jgi:uncharacterized protein
LTVFVDSSALFAFLDADDGEHAQALDIWTQLTANHEPLISTNYVVVETMALVQRRLGTAAVRDFLVSLRPSLGIVWIDSTDHEAAVGDLLAADRRRLSFVDAVSFRVMRRLGISRAFAFDDDFAAQGFEAA